MGKLNFAYIGNYGATTAEGAKDRAHEFSYWIKIQSAMAYRL